MFKHKRYGNEVHTVVDAVRYETERKVYSGGSLERLEDSIQSMYDMVLTIVGSLPLPVQLEIVKSLGYSEYDPRR